MRSLIVSVNEHTLKVSAAARDERKAKHLAKMKADPEYREKFNEKQAAFAAKQAEKEKAKEAFIAKKRKTDPNFRR